MIALFLIRTLDCRTTIESSTDYFCLCKKLISAKKTILERVDGYMKRAEDLKNVLEGLNNNPKGGNHNICLIHCYCILLWFRAKWNFYTVFIFILYLFFEFL